MGRSGSDTPARERRTASDTAATAVFWPIRRDPEHLLHAQELGGLTLQQPAGGDAGPLRDHLGDLVGSHLLGDHRGTVGCRVDGFLVGLGGRDLLLQRRHLAVLDARGTREVTLAQQPLGVGPQRVEPGLQVADEVVAGLLLLPARGQGREVLTTVREVGPQPLQTVL